MRDYKKDIIQIDDGMIGIPITAENLHDSKAIWDALKAAPTPKKGEQWRLDSWATSPSIKLQMVNSQSKVTELTGVIMIHQWVLVMIN